MAIDLVALRAKLAAKNASSSAVIGNVAADIQKVISNVQETKTEVAVTVNPPTQGHQLVGNSVDADSSNSRSVETNNSVLTAPVLSTGADRTVDIQHMDFLTKIQELQESIHGQHPKMPVLLMLIHKQIAADPELVTVLSEEDIGIIVNGLKIQTKTELVGTLTKQSKAKDKKTKLSVDLF